MQLNDENRPNVQNYSLVNTVDTVLHRPGQNDGNLFPISRQHSWSRDYGMDRLYVPKKGGNRNINQSRTIDIYERLIQEYENHPDFTTRGGKFYMGQEEITEYTFEMDYYFMMGDNRHYSYDSRFWGFVPENHVVGKAWFVLWSMRHDVKKFTTTDGQQVESRRSLTVYDGNVVSWGLSNGKKSGDACCVHRNTRIFSPESSSASRSWISTL